MKIKLYLLSLLFSTSLFAQQKKVVTTIDTTKNKIGAEFKLTLQTSVDTSSKVVFPKFTLIGSSPRGDSISIENIQGIYYPSWGKFAGKGGRLSWKRTGVGDDVYADLIRVNLDCKTGGYT